MDAELIRKALATGELNQDLAQRLFRTNGFFILQNCPKGVEFGLDYKSWTTADRFLGVKLIPPGVHYFFVAMGQAPRIGFFRWYKGNQIVSLKWDKNLETFADYLPSQDDLGRTRANLQNIDRELGAFPFETHRDWISLTNHIKEGTLERLRPSNVHGIITGQPETTTKEEEEAAKTDDPAECSRVDRDNRERLRIRDSAGLPIITIKEQYRIRFTKIPDAPLTEESKFRSGIDHSDKLALFAGALGGDYAEVLAEFQYAFVVFLIGQVYDGFEQWKRLIHLFSSCRGALLMQPKFFLDLLMVLYFQIKLCPDDFFEDVLSRDNFLATTLPWFFANVRDAPSFMDAELRRKTASVQKFFENKFKRSFDLPEDE